MQNLSWFVKQSVGLDLGFIRVSKWSFQKKMEFLLRKYWLIAKHLFYKRFTLGGDATRLFGSTIYYDSCFGLAGYQRILKSHQKLIQICKIKNAEVIVDIGANVGYFSMLCRELFPQARIYGVEPVPQTYECLKKNFQDDKNMSLFDVAISDVAGETTMSFSSDESSISQFSTTGNITVKTETLDNFFSRNNLQKIDILKIDVETFEAHVLRGASRTLEMTDTLFIEVTMENNNNYTISSLLKLLSTDKYDFQLVGFRNYADKGEGEMPIMDAVFKNVKTVR